MPVANSEDPRRLSCALTLHASRTCCPTEGTQRRCAGVFCLEMPHFQVAGPYTNQFALNLAGRSIVIGRIVCARPALLPWEDEISLHTPRKVRHNRIVHASSQEAVVLCSRG